MVKQIKFKKVYSGNTRLSYGVKSNEIREIQYQIEGAPITRNQLKVRLEKELKRVKERVGDDIQVMVNMRFGDRDRSSKWYIGKPSDLAEDLNMIEQATLEAYGVNWEFEDKVYQFALYFSKKLPPPNPGGSASGKHNDCLYNCLIKAFAGRIPSMKYPSRLKKFLGLDRDDPVHYNLIPKLEDKLKIRIHIHGDYEYTSPKQFTRVIYLRLKNGHYTISHHESKKLIQAVSFDEHSPIFFYRGEGPSILKSPISSLGLKNIFHTYDGQLGKMTMDEFAEMQRDMRLKPQSCPFFMVSSKSRDLEAEYNKFVKNADRLRDRTNGLINLYKNKGNMVMCIKRLFYNCSRCFEPEYISPQQTIWTDNALGGALIWGIKCELENAILYDFNSFYASVMNSNVFPLTEGEFFLLQELPEKLKYGIYRAIITGHDYRLFRLNKDDHYTHFDLKRARELKYKIHLIQDGNANALLYLKGKVSGKRLFGPTIERLYPLKQKWVKSSTEKKNPIGQLLSLFWGSLAKKRRYFHNTKNGHYTITGKLFSITPTNDGNHIVYSSERTVYESSYARVCPFITSLARYQMSRHIEANIENIFRVHTDGYIVNKELDLEISDKLGGIKIEKQGQCQINNSIDVKWKCKHCDKWLSSKEQRKHECI